MKNKMQNIIELHKKELIKLCEKHKVNSLFVFGSILTDKFNENSDIDFIVDFNPITLEKYADNYFNFKFSLEKIFNKNIDLLENQAIKNPYFLEKINITKQLIYGVRN